MDLLCSLSAHVSAEQNEMNFMQWNVVGRWKWLCKWTKNHEEYWVTMSLALRKIEAMEKGNLNDFK